MIQLFKTICIIYNTDIIIYKFIYIYIYRNISIMIPDLKYVINHFPGPSCLITNKSTRRPTPAPRSKSSVVRCQRPEIIEKARSLW